MYAVARRAQQHNLHIPGSALCLCSSSPAWPQPRCSTGHWLHSHIPSYFCNCRPHTALHCLLLTELPRAQRRPTPALPSRCWQGSLVFHRLSCTCCSSLWKRLPLWPRAEGVGQEAPRGDACCALNAPCQCCSTGKHWHWTPAGPPHDASANNTAVSSFSAWAFYHPAGACKLPVGRQLRLVHKAWSRVAAAHDSGGSFVVGAAHKLQRTGRLSMPKFHTALTLPRPPPPKKETRMHASA